MHSALDRAGLFEEVKDNLDHPALKLSGGQQQRLCIARALAAEPEVLLLDEPCSALDPQSTQVIEDLIVKLRDDVAVVIVTHNLQQAYRIADHVAFMYLGDLVEYGSANEGLRLARASSGPRSTSAVRSASSDLAALRRHAAARWPRSLSGCAHDPGRRQARLDHGGPHARQPQADEARAGPTATCRSSETTVIHGKDGTAIVVVLRNRGTQPVNDLPIAVGPEGRPARSTPARTCRTSSPTRRRSPPGREATWVYVTKDQIGSEPRLRQGRAPPRRSP